MYASPSPNSSLREPSRPSHSVSSERTIEAVMMQGNAMARTGDMEDVARERAMRVLHTLYLRQAKKQSDVMNQIRTKQVADMNDLDDVSVAIAGLEHDVEGDGYGYIKGTLPGDFVKLQTPESLQAGFLPNINSDDTDVRVLPLLRCLGPEHTLRLLAGLMCEMRIILVSADIVRVSNCVRAAAALLAQGNLSWRHNLVPVLPPHLLSCLAEPAPYLVGLLDEFLAHVEVLQSLRDVICIHLDKNQMKSFGMRKIAEKMPDLQKGSQGKDGIAGALFNDMQQILKAESRIWGSGGALDDKKKDDTEESTQLPSQQTTRRKKGKGKQTDDDIVTDIAGLFTKVMRGEALSGLKDPPMIDNSVHNPDAHEMARLGLSAGHVPRTKGQQHKMDPSTIETFDVCDNERGEEGLRAALTSFFLITHGDLGAMLTKGPDGFLLDRQKYLLSKKKSSVRERSPLFNMYKAFSGSSMLTFHLSQRIEDIERGRSLLMPRHRTLFALCERHLRTKKLDFVATNVRKVVSRTIVHSPVHHQMEMSEKARAKALALTSTNPYEGSVSKGLSMLMQDCHDIGEVLPQTMAVVWARIDDRKPNNWRHPLLGLHLLKNLLLHGVSVFLSLSLSLSLSRDIYIWVCCAAEPFDANWILINVFSFSILFSSATYHPTHCFTGPWSYRLLHCLLVHFAATDCYWVCVGWSRQDTQVAVLPGFQGRKQPRNPFIRSSGLGVAGGPATLAVETKASDGFSCRILGQPAGSSMGELPPEEGPVYSQLQKVPYLATPETDGGPMLYEGGRKGRRHRTRCENGHFKDETQTASRWR